MKAKGCLLLIGVVIVSLVAAIVIHRWFIRGDIHDAARKGNLWRIRAIIRHRPELLNAEHNNPPYWKPLHFAAWYGHKDIVEFLVSKGADIDAKDKGALTPLQASAEMGRKDIARFLLTKGADVNANDSDFPALHRAVMKQDVEMVKMLLANGANVGMKDSFGLTPLYWAADKGNKGLAEILFSNGAKVNVKSPAGFSPLHRAAVDGHKEMVEFLLANGADVNAKDRRGRTPLSCVLKSKHKNRDSTHIEDLLRKYGAGE